MLPEPLHPAVVHFPIVLAFLMPIAAAYAIVAIRRGAPGRRVWTPVLMLATMLFVSAWVSVKSGEAQEDTVEAVVGDAPIHDHEEAAERLLIAAGLLLGLTALGMLPRSTGGLARGVAAVASLVVLIMGIQVGGSGGRLVYTHGAAQAWVDAGSTGEGTPEAERPGRETDDDGGGDQRSP